MSRILVIDAGNSRMKWGLRGPRDWLRLGVTPNSEIGALSLRDWQDLPRPARAVGVNVAGEAARVRVEAQLTRWRLTPRMAHRDRVRVRRHQPLCAAGAARRGSLGVARRGMASLDRDRTVSAGVRRRQCGHRGDDRRARRERRLPRRIDPARDATHAAGACREHGGPQGADRRIPGDFRTTPRTRIYSGSIQAICGAIEQMRRRIDSDPAHVRCYLAGGAAPEIGMHLGPPVEVVDTLVLEGVLALAGEME